MKENRFYYKKNMNVRRIIQILENYGEALSTNQIFNYLDKQISTSSGRRYTRNPRKATVAQLLNKYPYFQKVGEVDETDIRGHRMRIKLWKLAEEESA